MKRRSMRLLIKAMVVLPALGLIGCATPPLQQFRVGESCDLNEIREVYGENSISETTLSQVNYKYYDFDCSACRENATVSVSPDGKILEVHAIVPCSSKDELEREYHHYLDWLKLLYGDMLKECGAKESTVVLKVEGYDDPWRLWIGVTDKEFEELVKQNNGKATKIARKG